jgi:hypothetical protein
LRDCVSDCEETDVNKGKPGAYKLKTTCALIIKAGAKTASAS